MTSYEKQRLEELGFMNAMLERGVSADVASVLVKDAGIEKSGSADPEMFVHGFKEELSRSEKGRAMLKRAFDSDDLLDNIGQWAKYLGVGLLGAALGYGVPKVYGGVMRGLGRARHNMDRPGNTNGTN
jgi:hypothetical protein